MADHAEAEGAASNASTTTGDAPAEEPEAVDADTATRKLEQAQQLKADAERSIAHWKAALKKATKEHS